MPGLGYEVRLENHHRQTTLSTNVAGWFTSPSPGSSACPVDKNVQVVLRAGGPQKLTDLLVGDARDTRRRQGGVYAPSEGSSQGAADAMPVPPTRLARPNPTPMAPTASD